MLINVIWRNTMKLYRVNDKGELLQQSKLEFSPNDVYLVDDDKTIYLWFGEEISLNQQDLTVKKARQLNKERGGKAKLLLMNQNREYGGFLAMMEQLKGGLKEDETIERRPELKMKEPKKAIQEITEKLPKVKGGVVDWLQQLQTYRAAAPAKETEPEPIPEPVPISKPESLPVVKPEPEKKPEMDIEMRVVQWLTQLVGHRKEVTVKKVDISDNVDELREQLGVMESISKDLERRRSLHEEVLNLISEKPKKKEEKREIPVEVVDDYMWEEMKENEAVIEKEMEEIPIYKEIPQIKIEVEREAIPEVSEEIIQEEDIRIQEVAPEIMVESIEEVEVDFHSMVNIGAYYLSQKGYTYDELCWQLAVKILNYREGITNPTDDLINPKAEEVFHTSCTYDELCWLIAELDVMNNLGYFKDY